MNILPPSKESSLPNNKPVDKVFDWFRVTNRESLEPERKTKTMTLTSDEKIEKMAQLFADCQECETVEELARVCATNVISYDIAVEFKDTFCCLVVGISDGEYVSFSIEVPEIKTAIKVGGGDVSFTTKELTQFVKEYKDALVELQDPNIFNEDAALVAFAQMRNMVAEASQEPGAKKVLDAFKKPSLMKGEGLD